MTEEIKQRIETIKAGKVPDGYKRTVVGIVPNEWENKRLSELLKFQNGVNADKEKYNSGIKMISVMDILSNRPIFYDNIRGHVDIDEKTLNNYSVTYGDILFQRSSETVEDAGKSNVYMDEENIATYSGFVIRGKKVSDYNPFYLNELLKSSKVRQQIIKYSAGSQHINVSQDSLSKVNVCFTNKYEQNRIAEILSKWDKVIELQEKLIEKLELQKKALMQRLLTPKEGWKKVKLESVIRKQKAVLVNTNENGKNPIIDMDYLINSSFCNYTNDEGIRADLNDVLLLWDGSGAGTPIHKVEGVVGSTFAKLTPNHEIFPSFLYYYLLKIQERNKLLREGSGVPHIPKDFLRMQTISFPTKTSQKNILNILENFDLQINYHHKKLEVLKQQQKAMQQLLITGIVRV
ncbi:restriction endonuclease subunit S [Anaerotignum lactatifermentans]|uniref:Type I restriction enzyme, S subunit n=1 Tax=Anaerotignum lactatifermentans DSM 14214 TaxID=1121323 RepID=A0A1M6TGZ1_9FIRM|nr:restriction endonuclease subunit S [Anaerotignum lactatifermentans]SHK56038.1 type I restriction enzyme, S subunit [[Clostridium] lactatifermentans DSM 14214] [Anaerotignum lactatifermentans DSM 14214]